jgi:hypothetical protein
MAGKRKSLGGLLLTLTGILMLNTSVQAANIETLFMPGKVIADHAKWESECGKCHARLSKVTQTQLCLNCHEETAGDVNTAQGFHGRSDRAVNSECNACHTEHIGRDGDIVRFNRAAFDHALTDFPLEGGHRAVVCTGCHQSGDPFSHAASVCNDCHGKQDPHKGNLGEKCDECHTPRNWRKFDFDHGETEFPLEGGHRKVECPGCHIGERYEDIAQDCKSCHTLDDVHNGNNGDKCEDCHNPRKWDASDFDHDRDTQFRLRGAHGKVDCIACHRAPVEKKKPAKECIGCHENDDRHQGRNGRNCRSCHNESDWNRVRFDHDRKTDFPLRGKHRDLDCGGCHRGELAEENLATDCAGCHRADDVHHGQEGDHCERCHQEQSWSGRILFDHDLTRFPLIGMHAGAPCEECHLSSAFKNTTAACNDCHADDEHNETLGTACGDCHNPNDWRLWRFDHDVQTEFKLEGAHSDLGCRQCHTARAAKEVRQSSRCNACHAQDDVHRGRFGRLCERCHSTDSFSNIRMLRQ